MNDTQLKIFDNEEIGEQLLIRLILDGIYPLFNKETRRFAYLKNDHGFYFGTSDPTKFNEHWKEKMFFIGEGALDDEQKQSLLLIDKFRTLEAIAKKK